MQAIQWIADNGGKHVEMAPSGYTLCGDGNLQGKVVRKAAEAGIDISSYTIGANFITDSIAGYRAEIERLKKEVDTAHALGVRLMRHDVSYRSIEDSTLENLEKDLPVCALNNNIRYASMVHLKDFYFRRERVNPGEGWFPTSGGNHLRGAIFGHGDVDVYAALKVICGSGYDGYLSLEFEGMEECRTGSRIGMNNVYRILKELNCSNIE